MHFGGIKLSKNERNKRICGLYFESKLTFSEISKIVKISTSQVSRIIRKNENYITEKNERKKETKIRHIESARKIMQKKRNSQDKARNDEKAVLDYLHNQASCELSQRRTINNRAFKKWNSSIYQYHNRTKEFRLKEEFKNKTSYSVPQKIKWK